MTFAVETLVGVDAVEGAEDGGIGDGVGLAGVSVEGHHAGVDGEDGFVPSVDVFVEEEVVEELEIRDHGGRVGLVCEEGVLVTLVIWDLLCQIA